MFIPHPCLLWAPTIRTANPMSWPRPGAAFAARSRPAWRFPCARRPIPTATSSRERRSRSAFRSEDHVKPADYFGVVSGRDTDKFAATGLTPVKSELVDAPYVKEFPLIVECRLAHVFELGLHTQFVGEVVDVKADESVMSGGKLVDIKKVKPFSFAPDTQGYYGIGNFLGQAFSIGKIR